LHGHVIFVGHKKTADILDDVSVLVLPSLVPETFGRVIIEAQAKGVAVVSTDLGAPKEIITDGETGLLTAAADAQGIADCVKRYFGDYALFSAVTAAARRSVEQHYTLDTMCSRTIEVYQEALATKNILVYKLSSLGDAVLATATIRTLKKEFPKAHVSVVVGKRFAPIFSGQACVDETIVFDDKAPFARFKAAALGCKLAKRCFDLSIDLQNSKTSQTISWFARVKKTVGVARKCKWVNDVNAEYRIVTDLSPLESQKYIITPIVKTEFLPALITADAVIRDRMRQQLKGEASCLIGINAGASAKWKTKSPDPRIYGEFIASYGKDAVFVFFGTQEYGASIKPIVELYRGKVIDMTGKTGISDLIALIAACDAVVTPDSAPLHIALALGVPVVSMFGPTDPSRHLDVHQYRHVAVLRKKMTCMPCYKKTCPRNRYACLDFSPQELGDAVTAVMQGSQR
jgi:lipopolysaccharide heptosyltransferase II